MRGLPGEPLTLSSFIKAFFVCLFVFWLSCAACRVLFPQPGIELRPSAQSPNRWTAREFPKGK